MNHALLSGSQAAARGAWEAGAAFACGCPGTPVTELLAAADALPGIAVQHAPNEKVALEVALGISRGGARVLAVMKHIGLNIAADPLITSAYAGVGGGLVIISIDDPGLLSSMNEQDTRHFARASKIPMFAPSDAQEILDFTKLAFGLSERYDVPVLVRLTSRLCYTFGVCQPADPVTAQRRPAASHAPKTPAEGMTRHDRIEQQLASIESFGTQAFELNSIDVGSPDVGIITSGISYAYAKEVMPDASFLKLGMIHPLPHKLISYFASLVRRVYVVEELDPYLEEQIRAMGIAVTGKDAFPRSGELSADLVAKGFAAEGAAQPHAAAPAADVPPRLSSLCHGCTHRGLMNVFGRLGLTVVGDIGCYTPGDMPPADPTELDACFGIGSSMSVAYGMSLAAGDDAGRRTVAVLSGSTFMHSGLPSLANIVQNGGAAVVCLLASPSQHDQDAGAIAGIDFRRLCEGVGVQHVLEVRPSDEEAVERTLRSCLDTDGVSVIISRDEA